MAKKKSKGKKKAAAAASTAAASTTGANGQSERDSPVLRVANAARDVLADFAVFSTFTRHGGDPIAIRSAHASDLDAPARGEMTALFELNMKAQYEASDWGYDAAAKREEMFDPMARYLVARDAASGALAGFAHFRFVDDEDADALYVFELQVSPAMQRRGLGRFLMQLLLLVARKFSLELVILTVFKSNGAALAFYRDKMGFEVDETSPSACGDASQSYEILSKRVKA